MNFSLSQLIPFYKGKIKCIKLNIKYKLSNAHFKLSIAIRCGNPEIVRTIIGASCYTFTHLFFYCTARFVYPIRLKSTSRAHSLP